MDFFGKMKDSLSTASQDISQKAKNASENMRITSQIRNNEKMIEKLTYQVGLRCVENHLNDANSEYEEFFQEILRLQELNRQYQDELQRLSSRICPNCGYENGASTRFCMKCGSPLTQPPTTAAAGKCCPNCGAANTEDAMFCTDCGTPFAQVTPEITSNEEE